MREMLSSFSELRGCWRNSTPRNLLPAYSKFAVHEAAPWKRSKFRFQHPHRSEITEPSKQRKNTIMKVKPRQNLIANAFAGVLALFGAVALANAAENKPNFVHIVADDLGWKDVGFNGCTDITTPNIDGLPAGGTRVQQVYVQPMCAPYPRRP